MCIRDRYNDIARLVKELRQKCHCQLLDNNKLRKKNQKLERENQNIKEERAKRETLWLDHQRDFLDKNLKLRRENKKMREYLELIVNTEYSFSGSATRQIAQECLKELEQE